MHLNAAVDLASKRLSEQISSDSLRVAKTTPSHRVGGSLLFPEERFSFVRGTQNLFMTIGDSSFCKVVGR